MADLWKVWAAISFVYTAVIFELYLISVRSPLSLGYVVVSLWIIVLIFNHRRKYYQQRHIDIDMDINIPYWRSTIYIIFGLALKILIYSLFIVGFSILWRNYLPISFDSAFHFLLGGVGR